MNLSVFSWPAGHPRLLSSASTAQCNCRGPTSRRKFAGAGAFQTNSDSTEPAARGHVPFLLPEATAICILTDRYSAFSQTVDRKLTVTSVICGLTKFVALFYFFYFSHAWHLQVPHELLASSSPLVVPRCVVNAIPCHLTQVRALRVISERSPLTVD